MKSEVTLVGLDIEGDWNRPLLQNAAAMSGASLMLARSDRRPGVEAQDIEVIDNNPQASFDERLPHIDDLLADFDHVIACEATQQSQNAYEFAVPRGRLAVVVGNELHGIPRDVLKRAGRIVALPMLGRGMSSVNVAVAAATILYVLQADFGRKRMRPSSLSHYNVDLLVLNPQDPNELGSLFRSVWAFGWQRAFLADRSRVWFSANRPTVLAGRAAARREVNPLVVLPNEELDSRAYDRIVLCDGASAGKPLSRFSLPGGDKILFVYGQGELPFPFSGPVDHVFVDHAGMEVEPAFRHAGSILLSVVSHLLHRGRRG